MIRDTYMYARWAPDRGHPHVRQVGLRSEGSTCTPGRHVIGDEFVYARHHVISLLTQLNTQFIWGVLLSYALMLGGTQGAINQVLTFE